MTTIKQLAAEDRPREKLMYKGRSALSDAELLAVLLGSGTRELSAVDLARKILASADHDLNILARLSVEDLMKFQGIGEAKAITIVSALELGRRRKPVHAPVSSVLSSAEAYEVLLPELQDLSHEEFWMLVMKRNGQLIRKVKISSGGFHGTGVDPKLVFKQALDLRASSVILAHNHPSGNLKPSPQDRALTKKLTAAGKLLELPVLDHLIFTDHGYYSFADEGEMGN